MKVAIIGAGAPGLAGFAFMEELRHGGVEVVDTDFGGDTVLRHVAENRGTKGKSGAARIKRAAKQRRNRKGK